MKSKQYESYGVILPPLTKRKIIESYGVIRGHTPTFDKEKDYDIVLR